MRITDRDRKLLEDIALHHVMTRDQLVRLGYFTSLQRANARLLELRKCELLRTVHMNPALETRQLLYTVGKPALTFLDHRIGALLAARSFNPRFIDHALTTVETRVAFQRLGATKWIPEPQIRHRYEVKKGQGKRIEDFRPDGLAVLARRLVFIEVDRGHVSLPRMKKKLETYRAYALNGQLKAVYGKEVADLLVVTTGKLRKRHIESVAKFALPFGVSAVTTEALQSAQSLAELVTQ